MVKGLGELALMATYVLSFLASLYNIPDNVFQREVADSRRVGDALQGLPSEEARRP